MKNIKLYLKEFIYRCGKKWDKMSANLETIDEYVETKLNKKPEKYKKGSSGIYTAEYRLAHYCGDRYNGILRKGIFDESIDKCSKDIKKYKTKDVIIVYRGVKSEVMDNTIKAAKDIKDIDIYDKAFLNTSLIKGRQTVTDVNLRIYIPKGTCAFYAGDVNEELYSQEVIVQKGAKMKIISRDRNYINCYLVSTD